MEATKDYETCSDYIKAKMGVTPNPDLVTMCHLKRPKDSRVWTKPLLLLPTGLGHENRYDPSQLSALAQATLILTWCLYQ